MNNTIFFFFYNLAHQSNFIDSIITSFAVYFIYLVIISAVLFSFFYSKSWCDLFLVVFSGGIVWILAKLLKILIHTPRPFDVFDHVQTLFLETGYAFPSGHTAVAAAIAFAIFFINKKIGYLFMSFALLIGLARIVAGGHFPVDILGGVVLGGGVSWFVAFFLKKI